MGLQGDRGSNGLPGIPGAQVNFVSLKSAKFYFVCFKLLVTVRPYAEIKFCCIFAVV